jgi:predicted ATPase
VNRWFQTEASRVQATIGPYRILDALGQGGMGVVFRGVHRHSGQIAAVKTVRVLRAGVAASLRREILALARVRHPGIVRILDQGVEGGLPWYAMEVLEGPNLRQHAAALAGAPAQAAPGARTERASSATASPSWTSARDTLDPSAPALAAPDPPAAEAPAPSRRPPRKRPPAAGGALLPILAVVRRLCAPLGFLHGEGIVHRDLKPDNVLVRPDGLPVIVDFGLMSHFGGQVSREVLQIAGFAVGTISYTAPEQLLGEFVDARADLYSLGCILYELVTGRRPFGGETSAMISAGHLRSRPKPPSELAAGVPRRLERLILQLLAKRPEERLGYAGDVAEALASLGAGEPNAALWPGAPQPRPYLYRPRLSGREEATEALEAELARLQQGHGGVVLVGGESGVGKTRLAMELARSARGSGMRVLLGEGLLVSAPGAAGSAGGGPLHPLRRALLAVADRCREHGAAETRRLLGPRGKVLALYEPALEGLPGLEAEPEPAELPPVAARLRLFRYLLETFSALARPLLLVLDDLHWADELTLGFLRFLLQVRPVEARQASPLPLVVGTYRSEDVGEPLRGLLAAPGLRRIELGRLDETAVRRMVGDMLALRRPPEGLVRLVVRPAEGNPFFVAEYMRTAVVEGLLVRDGSGRWRTSGRSLRLGVPRSIHDLVVRRLERRSPAARHLWDVAAVLGREIDEVLLAKMARLGGASLMEAIDELLSRQVLEEIGVGRLRFVHDTFREAAYERLEPRERRALHRAAAEALDTLPERERERHLGELGTHWEEAGELERARLCYRTGAALASARSAHQEAERLYRAYLALAPGSAAEGLRVRLDLGRDVLQVLGRNLEALELYREALDEARALGDAALELDGLRRLGGSLWTLGRIEEAREAWEQALRLARQRGDRLAEGKSLGDLALVHHTQGRLEEAQGLYERALAIQREAGDLHGVAIGLGNLAVAHDDRGDPEAALRLHEEALALARRLGDRRMEGVRLSSLGLLHLDCGRPDQALRHFELALDLLREAGERRQEGLVLGYLASLRREEGRLEEARSLYEQALAVQEEVGDRRSRAIFLGELAVVERRSGRLEQAEALIEEAEAFHRQIGEGDLLHLSLCRCERGHLALARGQSATPFLEEARRLAEAAKAGPRSRFGRAIEALRQAIEARDKAMSDER